MKRSTPTSKSAAPLTMEQVKTFSALVGRAQLAVSMGAQYGGDRNVYQALGYPLSISYSDYSARYARQDIAKAIIDRPISYTWKGKVLVKEVKDDKDTKLEKGWLKLMKDLKLKSKFVRLDKVSSIGSYGILLLGFNDTQKPEDFTKPVSAGTRQLLYVKPLGEGNAKICEYVKEPTNDRYGMPLMYEVTFMAEEGTVSIGTTTTIEANMKVHYSRVIHVAGELLESETFGEPVLKSVWNRLMDLEKLVGGSAEMFWRGARPGYQGKVDEKFKMTPAAMAELQDQVDEYENNLRRMLVNEGVTYEALESQVSDPSKHVDVQIQMISAQTGIPKRVLTGSERGELSSSQDRDAWFDVIQTRREEHAEVTILRPFVDICIKYKILSKPSTPEYTVEWSDLFAPSEKDLAEVGKTRAAALKDYVTNPAAEFILPPDAFFKHLLGFSDEQIDAIQEMANVHQGEMIKREEDEIAAAKLIEPNKEVTE